jgi:hypothetical protein
MMQRLDGHQLPTDSPQQQPHNGLYTANRFVRSMLNQASSEVSKVLFSPLELQVLLQTTCNTLSIECQ